MRDITGLTPPAKPVVRASPDGFRAKVWYRNGSGMLWRWFFYLTKPMPTISEALSEAKCEIDKRAEEVKADRELDAAMWRAMAKMNEKDREWRNNRQTNRGTGTVK